MTHRLGRLGRALVLGGALGLTACGGGSSSSASSLPRCANRAFLAERPSVLPESARVYSHERKLGADVVRAMAPGSLGDVREQVKQQLERSGYEIGGGEVEEHDAEAEIEGNGRSGRLKLRELDGCSGAVQVELALR